MFGFILATVSAIYIMDRCIQYKVGQHLAADQIPFHYKKKKRNNFIIIHNLSIIT